MLLKYLYVVFIGIMITLFIGVGVEAFYPSPKYPETYPVMPLSKPEATDEAKIRQQEIENIQKNKEFMDLEQTHNRNTSIILVIGSLICLVLGILMLKNISLINDGLLLAGVLTIIHAIIRSANASDIKILFLVVSVGLSVALLLGYLKFIRTQK